VLYKRLAAGAAALLVVGSGGLTGFRTSAPQQAQARADYSAPQVTITDWQFPDGFGPQNTAVADKELSAAMSDQLTLVDNNLNVQADLATRLPTPGNGDAKTVGGNLVVTWHIKPNQKWADGTPLTADQALFSQKLNMTPESGFPTGNDVISKMSAPDASTIVVTYKGIYGDYLYAPPTFYNYQNGPKKYGIGDVSSYAKGDYDRAAWLKTVLTDPNNEGSDEAAGYASSLMFKLVSAEVADSFVKPDDTYWNGPYKLGSYVTDQRIELVPNPNYNALGPAMQNGKALPLPSKIVFVSVSQNATAYAAALASPSIPVDKAEDFQVSDLPSLYAIKRFNVTVQNALELEHLELNRNNKYLSDVRVRKALALAINKVDLVHQLFPQIKSPASFVANTFYPNIHPYTDKSVKSVYDLAQAKRLLASAGYETDITKGGKHVFLEFNTTVREPRLKAADIIKRDWAKVGVVLKVNQPKGSTGPGGLFATWEKGGVLTHRTFDVALFAWQISPSPDLSGFFDPRFIPTAASHSGSQQNYSAVNDPVMTNAMARGLLSLDTSQRKKYYNQAQERLADQVYWIPLFVRQNITIDNRSIVNYKPNPSSAGNTWNSWEWSKTASAQ